MSTTRGGSGTLLVLAPQSFAQGYLERRVAHAKDPGFLEKALPSAAFLPVTERAVWVQQTPRSSGGGGGGGSSGGGGGDNQNCSGSGSAADDAARPRLLWLNAAELRQVLGLELDGSCFLAAAGENGDSWSTTPYLLGRESVVRFALPLPSARLSSIQQGADEWGWRKEDLRKLMSQLPAEELAVAGHAAALASWHALNAFCGRCGGATESIEGGAKRQCTRDSRHRAYPRTDPVAIMMVESPDGQFALLGRSHGHRPGMLTCLSGFIDQAESIEEAVRREAFEEAGIRVGAVAVVGSQPWPIGRGGSCELMIGCVAQALADALTVDPDEMEDVRWVHKDVVRRALEASAAGDHLANYQGGDEPQADIGFWLPPPYAIAHNLIREWATRPHSWFASRL